MFLCHVAAVASSHASPGPSPCSSSVVGRRRAAGYYNTRNGTTSSSSSLTSDLILLRFKAVDMFLCIDANDGRVRLKRIVSCVLSFYAESRSSP